MRLIHGDCLEVLKTLESGSVDAVVTDPPYPCIKRAYGYWTEAEWFALMRGVVPECMRVLKPTGSAVFVLQPNSERVGRMRTWLWDFMAWVGKEWGVVQDHYWWNHATLPQGCTITGKLCRPSVKPCVWIGPYNCYRNQSAVLWSESQSNAASRLSARCARRGKPSGHSMNQKRATEQAVINGGVTPFNLLPIANTNSTDSAGAHGHGAGTPLPLCSWWSRYICSEGGTVLDPFMGSGTVGIAASQQGKDFIGIEKDADYFRIASERLARETPCSAPPA